MHQKTIMFQTFKVRDWLIVQECKNNSSLLTQEKQQWFIYNVFGTYSRGSTCISTTHTITPEKGNGCRYGTQRIYVFYFSKFLSGLQWGCIFWFFSCESAQLSGNFAFFFMFLASRIRKLWISKLCLCIFCPLVWSFRLILWFMSLFLRENHLASYIESISINLK